MRIKTIEYNKQFKLNVGNYSNITVGMSMMVELGEDEKPNHEAIWDEINQQLQSQSDLDPSWMKSETLKKDYKLTVKIPKQEEINIDKFSK